MLAVCTYDHDQTTLLYYGGQRCAHDARRYRPRPRIRGPYQLLLCESSMVRAPRRAKDRQGSRIVEDTCEFLRNRHDAPPNMHVCIAILPCSDGTRHSVGAFSRLPALQVRFPT